MRRLEEVQRREKQKATKLLNFSLHSTSAGLLPPPIIPQAPARYFLLTSSPRRGTLPGGSPPSTALLPGTLLIIPACPRIHSF